MEFWFMRYKWWNWASLDRRQEALRKTRADQGGPLPQDFFKIMQFSGIFEQILGPGVKTPLGPLTKILDPPLWKNTSLGVKAGWGDPLRCLSVLLFIPPDVKRSQKQLVKNKGNPLCLVSWWSMQFNKCNKTVYCFWKLWMFCHWAKSEPSLFHSWGGPSEPRLPWTHRILGRAAAAAEQPALVTLPFSFSFWPDPTSKLSCCEVSFVAKQLLIWSCSTALYSWPLFIKLGLTPILWHSAVNKAINDANIKPPMST